MSTFSYKHLVPSVLLLSALLTMPACKRKELEHKVVVLEERVVLLEAALKDNQDRLNAMKDTGTVHSQPIGFDAVEDSDTAAHPLDEAVAPPLEAEIVEPADSGTAHADAPGEMTDAVEDVPVPDLDPAPEAMPADGVPTDDPSLDTTVLAEARVPQAYADALAAYRAGAFDTARSGFKHILRDQGRHTLAPNAAYWLAETAYSRNNFNQALVLFQQVVENYPDSGKAPDAMLKIGKCRERQGQDDAAIAAYLRLIDTYPQSEAAATARSWF